MNIQNLIRRGALALALALFISALVPVTAHAAECTSAWVELLQYNTVNNAGNNTFQVTSSSTITVATPQYMRCTKIDLLISHPSGQAPSSVKVRFSGTLYTLTLQKLDATTTRAYGDGIPDSLYKEIYIQINKTSSTAASFQLLSCRVSSLVSQEFAADAEAFINGASYPFPSSVTVPKLPATADTMVTDGQIRIDIFDWMKYDTLTIWGSSVDFPITSIRATIDRLGLPFTVSYMSAPAAGYWTETEGIQGGNMEDNGVYTGESWELSETELNTSGKWLYCITIDLNTVDRTYSDGPLLIYLTGLYDEATGYTFTAQYVNGSITVADTTQVSWWDRFTSFFTNLFGGDSTEADQFKDDMQQQGQEVSDAADIIDTVTRPNIDDIDININALIDDDATAQVNDIMQSLFGIPMVTTMVLIALMVALVGFVIFGKR